jgi:predicted metal-dependent hydrolase
MKAIDQLNFPVTVKRTGRRKTVALHVSQGVVHVTVPRRLTDKKIAAILLQKELWIRKKLITDAARPALQPRAFSNGETFAYLGRNYRLELYAGIRSGVKFRQGRLWLSVPEELQADDRKQYIRSQLTQWYLARATGWLESKTQAFAIRMGIKPGRIEVKYFKSRWGSCSNDGTIKYNWRIIMAPHRIIDYLVVHELAHLVHHNHSPKYWKCVESCLPDYRDSRCWLKEHGRLLSLEEALVANAKNR